jgi:hypothetical protein
MATKLKKAWLITWEDFGFKHWGLDKPRVVAVLSPRLFPRRVEQILIALWSAQADLTLSERMGVGLATKHPRGMLIKEDSDHFYLGLKPYLFARRVTALRCAAKDCVYTLYWKETPIYRLDPDSLRPTVVRKEFDDSWSQHENEAIGS